jgi:pimeloyl-ACP methyl ester carboxylesterase
VLGGESHIVTPEGVDEVRKRQPHVVVETVAGAGHSIQGDQPLALAGVLEAFLNA